MGKCGVRIRSSSKPPPPPSATASCLTLRSGRRVLPVAAASPAEKCSPRRHLGSALRWCGAEGAKKSACGGRPRRSGEVNAGSPRGRLLGARQRLSDDGQHEEEEKVLPSRTADTGAATAAAAVGRGVLGRGDSFERPKQTPLMTDDAAAVNVKAKKHENESHCRGMIAGQTPPTEAEIEAFFAAAELAERRRFAEAYNYDVALDRPLEGRFEWTPVSK